VEVDRIRDPPVGPAGLVLVHQRSALTVVTHPRHQVLEPRWVPTGERLPGWPHSRGHPTGEARGTFRRRGVTLVPFG
jgi:hypothetical protein